MATSLPSVPLPPNTWVDLYAATGIVAGTQLVVQNIGSGPAELTESATEPVGTVGFNAIPTREYLTNDAANVGAWAISATGTTLQVEAA